MPALRGTAHAASRCCHRATPALRALLCVLARAIGLATGASGPLGALATRHRTIAPWPTGAASRRGAAVGPGDADRVPSLLYFPPGVLPARTAGLRARRPVSTLAERAALMVAAPAPDWPCFHGAPDLSRAIPYPHAMAVTHPFFRRGSTRRLLGRISPLGARELLCLMPRWPRKSVRRSHSLPVQLPRRRGTALRWPIHLHCRYPWGWCPLLFRAPR